MADSRPQVAADLALDIDQITDPDVILSRLLTCRRLDQEATESAALLTARLADLFGLETSQPRRAAARTQCMSAIRTADKQHPLLAVLATPIAYNEDNKQIFRRATRKALNDVAKALGLGKSEFTLDWNPGGPAVSGDASLLTDQVHIYVSQGCLEPVMYRKVSGRRDYRGERNHWAAAADLIDQGGTAFAARLRAELGVHPKQKLAA